MTSWQRIGNKDDPNPVVAVLWGLGLSLEKSERTLGTVGLLPPSTGGVHYCEGAQQSGGEVEGAQLDIKQCGIHINVI
jgi:hypothetical protein